MTPDEYKQAKRAILANLIEALRQKGAVAEVSFHNGEMQGLTFASGTLVRLRIEGPGPRHWAITIDPDGSRRSRRPEPKTGFKFADLADLLIQAERSIASREAAGKVQNEARVAANHSAREINKSLGLDYGQTYVCEDRGHLTIRGITGTPDQIRELLLRAIELGMVTPAKKEGA